MSLIYRLALMSMFSLGIPLVAAAQDDGFAANQVTADNATQHKRHFSPLVDAVRRATAKYRDINVALAEGWARATPCVSGPNEGAMGVHFVLPSRLDGELKATEPEALIYEPQTNGAMRLVGTEFIVLVADWEKINPPESRPALEGQLTNLVGEPNRYGLPAFYEIHVWAWDNNPNGNFADFNTDVTCDKQPLEN
jgi:hypothetical protein